MNEILLAIKKLKAQRDSIVFESYDDEGAGEWYAHLTDVIEQLADGRMTIEQAGNSLGIIL